MPDFTKKGEMLNIIFDSMICNYSHKFIVMNRQAQLNLAQFYQIFFTLKRNFIIRKMKQPKLNRKSKKLFL